jgi:YhcH/YjgK/YiaL family protein
MIFDTLSNFKNYCCINSHFSAVADYFSNTDIFSLQPGKYDIDGEAFALVMEYNSKNEKEGFIESHVEFIDIQIVLKGKERMGFININDCKEESYNKEKDLKKLAGDNIFIQMKEGSFMILFPDDGHMPQINYEDKSEYVKKMVVKVPV